MKVGKADEDDFERVNNFYALMDALFDNRHGGYHEEDWREWDDDDEDKKEMLEIEKELIEQEGDDIDGHADNRLILFEIIKRRWKYADQFGAFGRIYWGAKCLIDEVCDPNLDYLEYKPELKNFVDELNNEKIDKNE